MQQRVLLWFILFLGTAPMLFAQPDGKKTSLVRKADAHYEQYAYYEAASLYQKAWHRQQKPKQIALQLARCYYYLREPAESIHWYGQADQLNLMTTRDKLYYAKMLESNGERELAKNWYRMYAQESEQTDKIAPVLRALDQPNVFSDDSLAYQIKPFAFNSPKSDFSPAYFDKGIVFVSAKGRPGLFSKTYGWNNQSYLDLYYAAQEQDQFVEPVPLSESVNTPYHEGPVAFYDQDTKMIFTRNGYFGGQKNINKRGVNHLDLFVAERKAGTATKWTHVQPFVHNSEDYSVGHPTISADGQRLYFVSDMPGGHGGTDLYVSHRTGGHWGKPENLGRHINTSGNEQFPFVHANGSLYFSSDGRAGMGGLDVFKATLQSDTMVVVNLGGPVNSSFDDFGFIINSEETQGFFSSNRSGQGDNDELYQFTYTRHPLSPTPVQKPNVIVSGVVVHAQENLPADSARVKIEDAEGKVIAEATTQANGTFQFSLDAGESYVLKANKKRFIGSQQPIKTERNVDTLTLTLAQEAEVTGTLTQKTTGKRLPNTKLELVDLDTNVKQEQVTDEQGKYVFVVMSDHDYRMKVLDQKKFFNQQFVLDKKFMEDGVIRASVEVEEIVLHKATKIENIYYNLNKATIRSEAAQELDKLVQLLKDNPSVVIELSSHTDARGSDKFNLELSDRRAKAAAAYIVSKGVSTSRIIGKGYGEYKLMNECADGVDCTEEQHQQNRRTEIAVIKH